MDDAERAVARHRELIDYIGWRDDDARRLAAIAPALAPCLPALVDDFYAEINRHPDAAAVITGGPAQVERLKGTLSHYLGELLRGRPDEVYAERCWRVGRRHAELNLDPVYVIAAMSRLRSGLIRAIRAVWTGDADERAATLSAVGRRLDLDLALIQDAYQAEYLGRLQRAERLATLGRLAGGLAHELRNPLNVVKTSAYFLKMAPTAPAGKRADHLERIGRGVDRADAVITALSDYAKMRVAEAIPTGLPAALREALEANPPGDRIELRVECPPGLRALVDPRQLQIVLGNLIRNACEAMPDGGALTLAARCVGGLVELDVEDTGTGIEPGLLEKITEPLVSTKVKGLGLGLAITREIVEKHGGSLRVASEPGRGSRFTVTLRAAEEGGGAS